MTKIEKLKPFQIVRKIKATGKNVQVPVEAVGRPELISAYGNTQVHFTHVSLVGSKNVIRLKVQDSDTCREEFIACLLDEWQIGECGGSFTVLLENVNPDSIRESVHLLNKLERKYRWALSRIMPIEVKDRSAQGGYTVYKSACLYIGSGMWRSTPFHVSALLMLLRRFSKDPGRSYKSLANYMKSVDYDKYIKDAVKTHPHCIEILIKHAARIKNSVVKQYNASNTFGLYALCLASRTQAGTIYKLPKYIQKNIRTSINQRSILNIGTFHDIAHLMGNEKAHAVDEWVRLFTEDAQYEKTVSTFCNLLRKYKGKKL